MFPLQRNKLFANSIKSLGLPIIWEPLTRFMYCPHISGIQHK